VKAWSADPRYEIAKTMDCDEAADGKDVLINGGADLARQALAANMIDELRLHLVPVVLSQGRRCAATEERTSVRSWPSNTAEGVAGQRRPAFEVLCCDRTHGAAPSVCSEQRRAAAQQDGKPDET
jgi:hypothetical protein